MGRTLAGDFRDLSLKRPQAVFALALAAGLTVIFWIVRKKMLILANGVLFFAALIAGLIRGVAH